MSSVWAHLAFAGLAVLAAGCAPVVKMSIPGIQGPGHRSPVEGQRVETEGVITAVGEQRLWMQDPAGDGNPSTSDALCLLREGAPQGLGPGQRLRVTGDVEEVVGGGVDLPVTCLRVHSSERLSEGASLPPAIRLGEGGRPVPTEVAEDDGFGHFEPTLDGADFFESLEGMRVEVLDARVVGATGRRGRLTVLADDGRGATVLTARGGLLRRAGDANPEALQVADGLGVTSPRVDLGHRLDRLEAVVDYERGAYRLRLLEAPEVTGQAVAPERTSLVRDREHLTLASFNVLNLSAADGSEKFAKLAGLVVEALGSPDLLALQEVQDDSGAEDDGVVAAGETLRRLIAAITEAGGPAYDFRQLDPLDGTEGGRPGGNIRVALLFDPSRVEAVDTAAGAAEDGSLSAGRDAPVFERRDGRLRLVPSPSRLGHPAFEADEALGWRGTRKPLIAQFRFRGRDFFVINQHLRSKGGDDSAFGRVQPPRPRTEPQRTAQAAATRAFVDDLLAVEPEAWVVVLGDLNEHLERPPVRVMAGAGLVNLVTQVPEDERYSYVYQGSAQVLDHVLVSRALYSQAAPEIDIVHACADYHSQRQASDHDPLVVRLRVEPAAE